MGEMKRTTRLEAFLAAVILIFFGVQSILTGEVPAFKGRNIAVPSTPFQSPLVPWIGLLFVVIGIYVLVRFFFVRNK